MSLDTTIPSTRAFQRLIAEAQAVQIKLVTGDVFAGKILWQDPECICLHAETGEKVFLWRSAVAFIRPHDS
ncbi:Hfq-related RNA-binding protein [Anthocerotibacter panamensis]|uniref:Hfq-related RNA-binding protein n=1 Tax=Anthocerotibacter panamensis TaxID=2857077 RepID=UPI001C407C9A|nr:hypothetical protein [Anthocerotibacter panamensis]